MKKKILKHRLLAAVLAAGCFCCAAGISASAVTVDDIANKARELGFPEAQVQQGYNEWATGNYTQEHLNKAWAMLLDFEKQSDSMFESIFEEETTEPVTEATGSGESDDSAADSTAPTEQTESVGTKEFVNMTLEEKVAYVNSLSAEDKKAFLNNLSPEERRSIIKQMSLGDKAQIMEGYIDFAETMGMHMTVDEITDDNISVTIRDKDGVIIDQSAVGISIDETGISRTGVLAGSAAGVLLALCGFAALYRCICRSDELAQ